MRTQEQKRASKACKLVRSIQVSGAQEEYKSWAKKLSPMILTNGLAQTLAFLRSRGRKEFDFLYKHIAEELQNSEVIKWKSKNRDLLERILDEESAIYRCATVQALSFSQWIARFADALLPVSAVQAVAERMGLSSGEADEEVKQNVSPKAPPLWEEKNAEHIPIDRLLGVYEPEKKEVIIYKKGTEWASQVLQLDKELLIRIVRLHEAAHAVMHLGRDSEGFALSIERLKTIPNTLNETVAQLGTYLVARDVSGELLECFEKLNARQPPEYRLWKDFKDVTVERINQILVKIRRGKIEATFEKFKASLEIS